MKMKKYLIPILLIWIAVLTAGARPTIVVATIDSLYPNSRPQWTQTECDAWLQKYGPIKGVNSVTGGYSGAKRKDILKKAKEMGFNSIRQIFSQTTAESFISTVQSWAADCAEQGITLCPRISAQLFYNNYTNKEAGLKALETFTRKVIQAFRNDDRIIMWDLWNEPTTNDATNTPVIMQWIQNMVLWGRQEGATQPLTSGIFWDTGNSIANRTGTLMTVRKQTEAMMDIHTFHDYGCTEDHNSNIGIVVKFLKNISDRPMVNTECLSRVSGGSMARNAVEYEKYHVGFYVYGLCAYDNNWEVKWSRSTYYAWEPMFHNMTYSDWEPYDPREINWVKNFRFVDENTTVDPGAAYTDRWTERRAWKWMSRKPVKGLVCSSLDNAITTVANHATDGLYNSVLVPLSYNDYATGNSAYYTKFNQLLTAAEAAGMTVLPTLLSGNDINRAVGTIRTYAYNFIGRYYSDRRIIGWNVYQQTTGASTSQIQSKIENLMDYVRYDFPNQPLFCTPLVSVAATPDSSAADLTNLMWKLSDVVSYTSNGGSALSENFLDKLADAYDRPIFVTETSTLPAYYSNKHVNWYTGASLNEAQVKAFDFTVDAKMKAVDSTRWAGWKAWQWMNRKETKGRYYTTVSAALNAIDGLAAGGIYNSVRVLLNYNDYTTDSEAFFTALDSLVAKAGRYGLTVLPALLADRNASQATNDLAAYVAAVVARYAGNHSIMAWDLYFCPGLTFITTSKLQEIIPAVFDAARAQKPIQPLFSTVSVTVKDMGDNYISRTTHGSVNNVSASGYKGWSAFTFSRGNTADLTYDIWCRSDVIGFMTSQQSPETGMLQDVAYRFGRPLFCTQWKTTSTEDPGKNAAFFANMHTNWYVYGTMADTVATNFKFIPVKTEH